MVIQPLNRLGLRRDLVASLAAHLVLVLDELVIIYQGLHKCFNVTLTNILLDLRFVLYDADDVIHVDNLVLCLLYCGFYIVQQVRGVVLIKVLLVVPRGHVSALWSQLRYIIDIAILPNILHNNVLFNELIQQPVYVLPGDTEISEILRYLRELRPIFFLSKDKIIQPLMLVLLQALQVVQNCLVQLLRCHLACVCHQ